MAMNVVYLGVNGAWGANVVVAGVPTQIPPIESYVHAGITIKHGVITEIDLDAVGGGGGTSNHASLSSLSWAVSGHAATANRLAGFDGAGEAEEISIGTGLSLSGGNLSCTVTSGTTDHTALSNLGWAASGHTGGGDGTLAGWGAAGAPAVYTISGLGPSIEWGSLTANRATYLDSNKKIAASATTATELGYLSGVTSAVQTQLGNKQGLDATLTALAAYNANGIICQTAADTFAGRTLTAGAGITVTNGDGVAGNPTVAITSPVAATLGGTGQTSYTAGDLLYASATNTLAKLPANTSSITKFLSQNGSDAAPVWQLLSTLDVLGSAGFGGRLTLESGVPLSTTDQMAKTTVYYTLATGATVPIYESGGVLWNREFAELSVAVPSTQFRLFDIFAYWDGDEVILETANWNQTTASISAFNAGTQTLTTSANHGLSVGDLVGIAGITGTCGSDGAYGLNNRPWVVATVPSATTFTMYGTNLGSLAYTSGGTVFRIPNTRTTALTRNYGILVKSGDITRTYLGTGMTTGVSGQTEMSFGNSAKLLLWNAHNQRRALARTYEYASHTYTTIVWRMWNQNPANRILFVLGDSQLVDSFVSSDYWGGIGQVGYSYDSVWGTAPLLSNANAGYLSGYASKTMSLQAGCHLVGIVEVGATGFYTAFCDLSVPVFI